MASLTVHIRPAAGADISGMEWEGEFRHFRRLYQAAYHEAQEGRKLILVAEAAGRLVGQMIVQYGAALACLSDGSSIGYLYSLRVREGYRGQGVGSQLIVRAEVALRARGFQQAAIAAAKDNPRALRLYERLGYTVRGEDPGVWSYLDDRGRVRKVSEPAFVLVKAL